MKQTLIYIFSIILTSLLYSCTTDEPSFDLNEGEITIVACPAPYDGTDAITKAGDESTITSLEFLIYDSDGILIDDSGYVVDDDKYLVNTDNSGLSDVTVCVVANVALSDDKKSSLSALKSNEISFYIDDETGLITSISNMPMFGILEHLNLTSGNGPQKIEIPLKRLLAKVDVTLEMGTSFGGTLDLNSYTVHNMPTKVTLGEGSSISSESSSTITSSSFSLPSFYVPEYIPVSTRQTEKPGNAPEHAVYITFEGVMNHPTYVPAPIKYHLYLGGNNSDDFSLVRNTYYNNVMTINGVGDAITQANGGTGDQRVEYSRYNLANPSGLATDVESANCYIITEPGRYMFPAVKGNGDDPVTGDDTETISDGTNTITNVMRVDANGQKDDEGEYIAFDVPNTVANGNSVLIYGDWSWHLWFCTEVPDDEIYPNGSGVTSPTMMGRNLGAGPDTQIGWDGVATTDFHPVAGLYYRYGNKNPFFKDISSYQGPGATGSWDSKDKTITDPCPPGYVIPSSGVWTNGLPADELTRYIVDGSFLYSEDFSEGEYVRYPFASYLDGNGNKVPYDPKPDGPNTYHDADPAGTIQYDFNIQYSGKYDYLFTRLFADDMAIECKYSKYTVDERSLVYSGEFTVSISGVGSKTINVTDLTQDQLKAHKFTVSVKIPFFGTVTRSYSLNDLKLGSTVDSICKEILSSIKNSRNDTMELNKLDLAPKTNGHQIRCQKITE